ncbi:XrtV sorting system accessory protein [Croceibacterium salegens]|uniref:XrtV sorting system accessory protein n=1 Tax=Croceibacterium salegens TaxID=1737568 RepID=UPI002E25C8C2
MQMGEEATLETFWDWFTIFCFAGLVTLLLQRSSEEAPRDKLWQYAPPAIGLAVANYFGNEGNDWLAVLLTTAAAAYVALVLKPRIWKR